MVEWVVNLSQITTSLSLSSQSSQNSEFAIGRTSRKRPYGHHADILTCKPFPHRFDLTKQQNERKETTRTVRGKGTHKHRYYTER